MKLQPRPSSLVELASGVDSLYFTGRGIMLPGLLDEFEKGRQSARDSQVPTPFSIGGEPFLLCGSGLNRYPYRLAHRFGVMGVSGSATLPALYIQPFAEHIHSVGISSALEWWKEVGASLLDHVEWKASRLDLFMDSQGWSLGAADREAFVARSSRRVMYEHDSDMQTLMFGGPKSAVKVRIYDKTAESAKKGTDWLPQIWGSSYRPGERVLRVEFQVGRTGLTESGIETPDDALRRQSELWGYLTEKWISLRVPTADETRSRWPVAPEWEQIQRASLRGSAVGLERVRAGASAGGIRLLTPALIGYLAAVGALMDAESAEETLHRVLRLIRRYEEETGKPFTLRILEKRLGVAL